MDGIVNIGLAAHSADAADTDVPEYTSDVDRRQYGRLCEHAAGMNVLGDPIIWPQLEQVGLDDAQLRARTTGIGGSDANIIVGGDPERLIALWREKRGEGAHDDLSGVLPVMLGSWTRGVQPAMVYPQDRARRDRIWLYLDIAHPRLATRDPRWPRRGQARGVGGQACLRLH